MNSHADMDLCCSNTYDTVSLSMFLLIVELMVGDKLPIIVGSVGGSVLFIITLVVVGILLARLVRRRRYYFFFIVVEHAYEMNLYCIYLTSRCFIYKKIDTYFSLYV